MFTTLKNLESSGNFVSPGKILEFLMSLKIMGISENVLGKISRTDFFNASMEELGFSIILVKKVLNLQSNSSGNVESDRSISR